tara:strand:- start:562 stop:765 length:204 start_codon:yes stop_codon:yes gene_type:complete
MDRIPATQNQKLLMDIQYQIKELNSLIVGLKYEVQYIKSNLHFKPIEIKKDIEEETPESIKNWWWSA